VFYRDSYFEFVTTNTTIKLTFNYFQITRKVEAEEVRKRRTREKRTGSKRETKTNTRERNSICKIKVSLGYAQKHFMKNNYVMNEQTIVTFFYCRTEG
jgi:hypothetical protein